MSYKSNLPLLPSYVSRYTSFETTLSYTEIYQKMMHIMSKIHRVADMQIKNYSYQFTYYFENVCTTFRYNFFRSSNGITVEFQHINGDKPLFNKLYKIVKMMIDGRETYDDTTGPLPVPIDEELKLDVHLAESLNGMLLSDMFNVKKMALDILSFLSKNSNYARILRTFMPVFDKIIKIEHQKPTENLQAILYIIKNISVTVNVNPLIIPTIIDCFEFSENSEVHRLAAICLYSISTHNTLVLRPYFNKLIVIKENSPITIKIVLEAILLNSTFNSNL